ncbi:SPOR domain-containing protein [Ferrimonas pelagia]|uniref:Cell division protein DedD n=1 Tax=Ferrimonas pelagia TaxID=1177826 RepID=A0ABP9EAE5_9GAMM
MAKPLHNRLVGTVVIVALGVMVLPDLLNGEKTRVEEQFATIPLRPALDVTPDHAEVFEPIVSQAEPVVVALQDDATNPAPEPGSAPVVDASVPKPEADEAIRSGWSIRLGSFRSASNVNRLVQELRAQDYPAYTVPAVPQDGELTVVFVGPEIEQKRIKALQQELAERHSLQTQLVRYDPLKI